MTSAVDKPIDTGTPELQKHHSVALEPTSQFGGRARVRVTDQRRIDAMLEKGQITKEQWDSANSLLRLAYTAGWLGAAESQIGRLIRVDGQSGDNQLGRVEASVRIEKALEAVRHDVGTESATMLRAVVIEDAPFAYAKRLVRLRWRNALKTFVHGLNALGDHFDQGKSRKKKS